MSKKNYRLYMLNFVLALIGLCSWFTWFSIFFFTGALMVFFIIYLFIDVKPDDKELVSVYKQDRISEAIDIERYSKAMEISRVLNGVIISMLVLNLVGIIVTVVLNLL